MIEANLTHPEFIRRIRSPEFLPWGLVLFSVEETDYLHANGWLLPVRADQKAGLREWARMNQIHDFSDLSDLTRIPGNEQWYDRGGNRKSDSLSQTSLDEERAWIETARHAFGPEYRPAPSTHPWFDSTVIGACREKNTGDIRLAVIQFSPPPPFFSGIHPIPDFEFLRSPFAVTLEEYRAQKTLAYGSVSAGEFINLDAGDGLSYSRIEAPFYTWPKEGPIPMLSSESATGRSLVSSEYEFEEPLLFFAWF